MRVHALFLSLLMTTMFATGCSDAEESGEESNAGMTTPEMETIETVQVRIADLVLDFGSKDVCWRSTKEGASTRLLEQANLPPLTYGKATRYLDLPLVDGGEVGLVASGNGCEQATWMPLDVRHEFGEHHTLALLGDAVEVKPEFFAILMTDELTPAEQGAKTRNLGADPVAPAIDVGVQTPAGVLLIFRSVVYSQLAQGSDLPFSPLGYTSNIPTVGLPVYVWPAGEDTALLRFDQPFAFENGGVYTIFPAGRVTTGQAEALLCIDGPGRATPEEPWANCVMLIPEYVPQ